MAKAVDVADALALVLSSVVSGQLMDEAPLVVRQRDEIVRPLHRVRHGPSLSLVRSYAPGDGPTSRFAGGSTHIGDVSRPRGPMASGIAGRVLMCERYDTRASHVKPHIWARGRRDH